MLQLILGILKVIGILLLAVFLLLILAVLSLLFVPVRYEAAGKKKKGALAARVKVSWLLRLISVQAVYLEGKIQVKIKLFGVTLKKLGLGGEGPTAGHSRRKRREPPPFEEDSGEGEDDPSGQEPETAGSPGSSSGMLALPEKREHESGREQNQPPGKERSPMAGETPDGGQESGPHGRELVSDEMTGSQDGAASDKQAGMRRGLDRISRLGGRGAGILRRIAAAAGKLLEFILYLPQRILGWIERLGELLSSGENFVESCSGKIEELRERAAPFLEPEAKALYQRLLGHGKYLLRHYGPRKIQGWIRLGAGRPDVTAQLSGIIYYLLPVTAQDFEVRPEFSETVLEGDVLIKGRVRSCHVVKIAFLLWRDKEFRKMLGKIKGGI